MADIQDIRETFNRFRKALNETAEPFEQENSIPYTQQDELLQTSTQTAKQQFGADFSKVKNPMYYVQDEGNVVLTGNVPTLNDIKFQFKFKSDNGVGCSLWTNSQLILSKENLKELAKIYGVYENWKEELTSMEDIKPMNLKNEE